MPDAVFTALGLDRRADGAEIKARLEAYVGLLLKWQRRINLIGPATAADVWRRHILDCGQVIPLLPAGPLRVCDLGSGAGLPGLILAAFGVGADPRVGEGPDVARGDVPAARLDLVESDGRKAAFLREANRVMGTHARVLNNRIEAVGDAMGGGAADEAADGYDVITARALAPLPKLLAMSENLLKTSGQLLFLKGRGADAELTESEKTWRMTASKTPSVSDPEGVLLLLTDIERRHG